MGLNDHHLGIGLRRIAGRLGRRLQARHVVPGLALKGGTGAGKPSLLIVGHSHIECLSVAAAGRPDLDHVAFLNLRHFPDGDDAATKTLKAEIARFAPDAICLCLAGNQHNLLGLIENPVPFAVGDARDGAVPAGQAERVFIPHAVIRDQIEDSLPLALATAIFSMVPDGVRLYLDPPPPIADLDHLRHYPGVFKDKIQLGFAPNELRLALYRIQSEVWGALAQREGAALIAVDPRLVDEAGFLGRAYFKRDPTHGNVAYGRVMLDRILQAAARAA